MGWWSAQCGDFNKLIIAAGRARQQHQQCKRWHIERVHRSGSDCISEYLRGLSPSSRTAIPQILHYMCNLGLLKKELL
jgi:hypothetical protein